MSWRSKVAQITEMSKKGIEVGLSILGWNYIKADQSEYSLKCQGAISSMIYIV